MQKSTTKQRRTNGEHPIVKIALVILAAAMLWLLADGFAERRAIEARQRESIRLIEEGR